MKPKILIACPTFLDLHLLVIKNLKNYGFEVTSICIDETFKYQSVKDRLINLYRKTILKDITYKRQTLYYPYKEKKIAPILKEYNENYFDYSLVIRPDIYPINTLNRVNYISKKSIGYQWDGLNRFPEVFKRISIFDKFFVFDSNDYNLYRKEYSNLFYTDNFYSNFNSNIKPNATDVYYLGSFNKQRIIPLINIYNHLKPLNLSAKIILNYQKDKLIKPYKTNTAITFSKKTIDYYENISQVANSKVVLDFKFNSHNGLSFRFFECIKYETKIITDNKNINTFDFYHPQNIFIIGIDSYSDLEDFIRSPYLKLNSEIYLKYSFANWIDRIIE